MNVIRKLVSGIAIVLALSAFGGCSSLVPGAAWKQRTGQLHYVGGGKNIVADIAIRHTSHAFRADISKGPSAVILTLSTKDMEAGAVRVAGPMAFSKWSGRPENAPKKVRVFALLPQAFGHALSHSASLTQFAVEADGNRIVCLLNP
jgi:hypothetical protein